MGRIGWYVNRLRAMSAGEVLWRIGQRWRKRREDSAAAKARIDVSERLLYPGLSHRPVGRLNIGAVERASGATDEVCTDLRLLGGYDYAEYRERWNAGFNTPGIWPDELSSKIDLRQCEGIGDVRVNWELNRGYQFVLLARSGDVAELDRLLDSWCVANPWLRGVSWTSAMEVAIRAVQWTTAAYYLSLLAATDGAERIRRRLETGALNMAMYVCRHYSRYSSANNHLLVEAMALVYVGSAFGMDEWEDLGLRLLDEELLRQNCTDGVNREMSLHYQSFGMEAYALAILVSSRLGGKVPDAWSPVLRNMCDFVVWSVSAGVPMEWGDNDEGKVIDLTGGIAHSDHYGYVLRLYQELGLYRPIGPRVLARHFGEGGYTFARSADGTVLVGMDHAALGFGSIAAHGHADALSIQVVYRGRPLLTDPGTYVYHCDRPRRDRFRSTLCHNTVCVEGRDQSEMLGAFLWGRKANVTVEEADVDASTGRVHLKAWHDGYDPVRHTRTVDFDGVSGLKIRDELSQVRDMAVTYVLGTGVTAELTADGRAVMLMMDGVPVAHLGFAVGRVCIEPAEISTEYGVITASMAVRVYVKADALTTVMYTVV